MNISIKLLNFLLNSSNESDNVSQIAYSVAFSSQSYFIKCFKEQFGVTPGQYVEEHFSQRDPSDKSKV